MILLERTMVNLSSNHNRGLLGHVSIYKLDSGNLYYSYYIEERFYAAKEICKDTGRTIREESSDNDYHYNVDIFFNDKTRYLGWSEPYGGVHFSD